MKMEKVPWDVLQLGCHQAIK